MLSYLITNYDIASSSWHLMTYHNIFLDARVNRILTSRARLNHRDSNPSAICELPQDDKYPCESW